MSSQSASVEQLRKTFAFHLGGAVDPEAHATLQTTRPDAIAVYRLGVEDVSLGAMERLKPSTWLAWADGGGYGVELNAHDASLHALREGAAIADAKTALLAPRRAEMAGATASILRVEALYIEAVWLRPNDHAQRSVIEPVGKVFAPLVAGRFYDVGAFVDVVGDMVGFYRRSTPSSIGGAGDRS